MGIVLGIIGYALLGIALLTDKHLLKRPRPGSALAYAFWIGILSAPVLLIIPFGFHAAHLAPAVTAAAAGIFFFLANIFFYSALQNGEASHTPTIVGGFTPIITALIGSIALNLPLNIAEKIAFGFLVAGGCIMFLSERFNARRVLPWVLGASTSFAIANILQKMSYDALNFVTVLALFSAGMVLGALALLTVPLWRKEIFSNSRRTSHTGRTLYFANRAMSAIAVLLIFYAVKIEHPALVDALSGVRAVIVFLGALLLTAFDPRWLKERFKGFTLILKITATLVIGIGLVGLGAQKYYESKPIPPPESVLWGVTFSEIMAKDLGLDPQETYRAILEELRPAGLRLIAYWENLEPEEDVFRFERLDAQIEEARIRNIPVILAVGQKVPRWPECHIPSWARENPNDKNQMTNEEYERELLEYLRAVVEHYKNNPAIAMWQIENEPFLRFGDCDHAQVKALVDKEITLVKSLDPARPILTTDGGEFGDWYRAAQRGDVFGTTLYRKVYNGTFGYITYPFTPEFYPLKKDVVQFLTGRQDEKFIVAELGLEPWGEKPFGTLPVDEQRNLFGLNNFNETIAYARRARFDTYYLWGAEWWYALKTRHGDPSYWNAAREVISSGKVKLQNE